MSKINIPVVAENFVNTQDYITRLGFSKSFAKNPIEKAARNSLIEQKTRLNTLRLLILTKNITEEEFLTQAAPVNADIEKLEKIVHPE